MMSLAESVVQSPVSSCRKHAGVLIFSRPRFCQPILAPLSRKFSRYTISSQKDTFRSAAAGRKTMRVLSRRESALLPEFFVSPRRQPLICVFFIRKLQAELG